MGSGGDEARRDRAGAAAIAVAAACAVATSAAVLLRWVRHDVNEDQALLWAAAESWARLRPRQPAFWGQRYGTTFEAIPAAAIHHASGVGYQTALPLAVTVLNLAGAAALAWVCWRRRRVGLAVVAVGTVSLLSPEFVLLSVAYNTAVGRLLGAVAVAVGMRRSTRWRDAQVALAIGALGTAFDNSVALAVAPLAVHLVWTRCADPVARASARRPDVLAGWALALAPAVAWTRWVGWWYDRHPGAAFHPAPSLDPSWHRLLDNLANPSRHLGVFGPELFGGPVVPLAAVAALAAYVVWRRQWRAAACLGALTAVVLLVLSVPRANEALATPYYPASRVLLALPVGIAVVLLALDDREAGHATVGAPGRRWPAATLAALCVLSLGVRLARWDTQTGALRGRAIAFPNYPLTPAEELRGLCAGVAAAADREAVRYVVFDQRTAAYACAATAHGIVTIYPQYERRSWILTAFLSSPDHTFLYVGDGLDCPPAGPRCVEVADGISRVTAGAGTANGVTLQQLGIPVRPL